MSIITHKYLKIDELEDRLYQSNISKACLEQSTLVILPTGMGKTVVAIRIMIERLDKGKILLMAPTKPLAQQHFDFFNKFLADFTSSLKFFVIFTPKLDPSFTGLTTIGKLIFLFFNSFFIWIWMP